MGDELFIPFFVKIQLESLLILEHFQYEGTRHKLIRKNVINILILNQMEDSNNNKHTNADRLEPRGRIALDIWHKIISKDDEKRINVKISNTYKVDLEEARDIHINYHSNRIISLLLNWAKKNGMTESTFVANLRDLDVQEFAYQASMGEVIEIAAVELLYKQLCDNSKVNSSQTREDRYINFYS